jgi:hypothetical protein
VAIYLLSSGPAESYTKRLKNYGKMHIDSINKASHHFHLSLLKLMALQKAFF